MTSTLTPTGVHRVWFPATVRLPGETQARQNVKVYATPQGLFVYAQGRVSDTPPHPLLFAEAIDYDKTQVPPTSYAAARAGIHIYTESGPVVIQPQGGCGCNFRRLKNWTPDWARKEIEWGVAA